MFEQLRCKSCQQRFEFRTGNSRPTVRNLEFRQQRVSTCTLSDVPIIVQLYRMKIRSELCQSVQKSNALHTAGDDVKRSNVEIGSTKLQKIGSIQFLSFNSISTSVAFNTSVISYTIKYKEYKETHVLMTDILAGVRSFSRRPPPPF